MKAAGFIKKHKALYSQLGTASVDRTPLQPRSCGTIENQFATLQFFILFFQRDRNDLSRSCRSLALCLTASSLRFLIQDGADNRLTNALLPGLMDLSSRLVCLRLDLLELRYVGGGLSTAVRLSPKRFFGLGSFGLFINVLILRLVRLLRLFSSLVSLLSFNLAHRSLRRRILAYIPRVLCGDLLVTLSWSTGD